MKKSLFFLSLLLTISIKAQTKKTELSAILSNLIPEKEVGNWTLKKSNAVSIVWKTPNAVKGKKSGKIQLVLGGEPFVFNDKYIKEVITLNGTTAGYNHIFWDAKTFYWSDPLNAVKTYLLKNKAFKLTTIKEVNQGFSNEYYAKLEIPMKTTAWIKLSEFNNKEEMNTYFSMDIFLSSAALDKAIKDSGN